MKIDLIRDKVEVAEGEVRPVNSLPGRQLALIAQLHQELGALAQDGAKKAVYANLLELMREMMRINEVDWQMVEEERIERLVWLGGFRRGLIWTREIPERPVESPGYPEDPLTVS